MKIAMILLYFAVLLGLGILASRRTKDLRDYFAGSKRFGFLAVAFSARATGESAWLLLGLTGMGAAVGVHAFWVVVGEVLGVMGAWLLLSRRFKRLTDRYDSITIPDYLESRLRDSGHVLRLIACVSLLVFVPIYVSAQIHSTGFAFEKFLGWNYYTGALVGFGVVCAYIVSGGFVAVVWSDVFQGLLMFGGLVAMPLIALADAGSVDSITSSLREIDPALLDVTNGLGWSWELVPSVLAFALIGLGFLGSPQVFVRFLSLKSEREIPKGALVAFVWTVLADSGAVLTGVFGRALLEGRFPLLPGDGTGEPRADYEAVLPMMVDAFVSPLLAGLYIAVVLAAIMSTIDSLLVVASSAGVRDWYQKTLHPDIADDRLVLMSRIVTLALACVALALALGVSYFNEGQQIFWFVIFGWSGIAATFCPTMILSLFWSGLTSAGAKAAMVTGFICIPVFKFVVPALIGDTGMAWFIRLEELGPSFVVSGVAGVVISLLTAKPDLRAETQADLVWAAGKDPN